MRTNYLDLLENSSPNNLLPANVNTDTANEALLDLITIHNLDTHLKTKNHTHS